MKNTILFLILVISCLSFSVNAQMSPWLNGPEGRNGNKFFMYPSFIELMEKIIPARIDHPEYIIKHTDMQPGILNTNNLMSPNQALTIALTIVGGQYEIDKFGISRDKPNIISYKKGFILCGYNKKAGRWELFNIPTTSIKQNISYRYYYM